MKNYNYEKIVEARTWCNDQVEEMTKRQKLINLFENKILHHLDSKDLIKVILFVTKAINDGDLKLNSWEEYEKIDKLAQKAKETREE